MSEYLGYGGIGVASRDQARSLFGQTMGYVAATAGFFALGCYLSRNLSPGWAIVVLIVLIVFGIVLIFVRIPHGSLIYSVPGLGIFAVLTMADFQRLRRTKASCLGLRVLPNGPRRSRRRDRRPAACRLHGTIQ
jgi:FtsH-binding integral membrane protein